MKKEFAKEKLKKIFFECQSHIKRLKSASSVMQDFMPLDSSSYKSLSEDRVVYIDQFLFRFAKLQDTMGQKLFLWILICLDEEVEGKPFVDILNKMEKLSLIDSANEWRALREDRNELAHNYEDDEELMSEAINKIWQNRDKIINIYKNIEEIYKRLCK